MTANQPKSVAWRLLLLPFLTAKDVLISKHVPQESQHEIYRPTQELNPAPPIDHPRSLCTVTQVT